MYLRAMDMTNTFKGFRNYDTWMVAKWCENDAKFKQCFFNGYDEINDERSMWLTMNDAFRGYFNGCNQIALDLIYSSLNNVDWEQIMIKFGIEVK
jgi:hypothetical protein